MYKVYCITKREGKVLYAKCLLRWSAHRLARHAAKWRNPDAVTIERRNGEVDTVNVLRTYTCEYYPPHGITLQGGASIDFPIMSLQAHEEATV